MAFRAEPVLGQRQGGVPSEASKKDDRMRSGRAMRDFLSLAFAGAAVGSDIENDPP
jgi:hypothetical protein